MMKPNSINPITALQSYELINEREVAKILCVSVSKLQKDRIQGDGVPFVSLGRSVRYKISDVVAYIEGNKRSSTSHILQKRGLILPQYKKGE